MDFFQFLQNSSDTTNSNKGSESKIPQVKNVTANVLPTVKSDRDQDMDLVYKTTTLKNGEIVKIVYMKGSLLNSYKGYIGEVKNYKKDQEFAQIFLHSITHYCVIKFPLAHFVKYDPYLNI